METAGCVCEFCEKSFDCKSSLSAHRSKKHRELATAARKNCKAAKPYKCTVGNCQSSFSLGRSLNQHVKNVHGDAVTQSELSKAVQHLKSENFDCKSLVEKLEEAKGFLPTQNKQTIQSLPDANRQLIVGQRLNKAALVKRTEKKKLEKAKKAKDGSAVKVARAEKSASCAKCFEPAEKDRFVCINNEYYHDDCFPDVLS